MKKKILNLKKEKNAVILAHYYAPAEIQETGHSASQAPQEMHSSLITYAISDLHLLEVN